MRTVFRAQAADARRALLLCWAFVLGFVVLTCLQAGTADGSQVTGRLAAPLLGATAALLFVRLQLARCRGGEPLAAPWLAPLTMALSVAPMMWGTLTPMMILAWAPALIQRSVRQGVILSVALLGYFLLVFPRSGLQSQGGFGDLFLELAVYALILVAATRLVVLLDHLQFTREVLARRQIDVERERVGRDLHDIMGRTLVAASLRNQAALNELGERDQESAQRLEGLHEAISRGQAQLRALTTGPTVTRLDEELVNSRMLCERVQIDLDVDVRAHPPRSQEGLVALVVREGTTNVLKHSRATSCRIVLDRLDDQTVVTVGNDGSLVGESAAEEDPDSRLARVVAAAGGKNVVTHRAGRYESVVRLPIDVGVPT